MSNSVPPAPCVAYCLAQRFNFQLLAERLLISHRARTFRDALIIDHQQAWSIIFAYGTVVHWNVVLDEQTKLHNLLLGFCEKPLETPEEDNFTYGAGYPRDRIQQDHIELQTLNPMVLLALSHGLAQSVKLSTFETNAIRTIRATSYLPQSLALEGKIALSRAQIAKIRGQLFLTKSDIFLHYDLLDTPEFFWEHPEYESTYRLAANYLEIPQRTDVLSKKLETIHELFEMLADEQNHLHSATLEWIIIWLIGVEIILSLIDKLG